MSPAPQAVSPRGKQTSRVALTHGIKKFLRERPVILLPELNDKKQNMKHTIKKPLQNGQKVRLPMSKMTIVNELLPNNNNSLAQRRKAKDLRDDESRKQSFLSALNLVDIITADKNDTARASVASEVYAIESTLGKKFRARKGQVVSFFRNNPVPISSILGRKIVLLAGFGKCPNPTDEAHKIDKICSLHKFRNLHTSVQWPEVNTRKSKLKGQYIHTYSFGRRQRSKRQVELTIGLSEKSFPLFNQCRGVAVQVHRMTDEDIALELTKLSELSQWKKGMGASTLPYHWISSAPLAGPSRGRELIRTPVVELYDIRQSPSKAKYFR